MGRRGTADVLSYHGTHKEFPQQSTVDQFLDEAQWESYCRLGEWMTKTIFSQFLDKEAKPRDGWRPFKDDNLNTVAN